MFVVDVDTELGKVGADTYFDLDLKYEGGFPETETVTTPSGDFHKYYNGRHVFALGGKGRGLGQDIDSPNYVLIAGSTLADGTSYKQEDDTPTAPAPEWFYKVINAAKVRAPSAAGQADAIPLDVFERMLAATPYTGGPDGLNDRREQQGWFEFMVACHEAAGGDQGEYKQAFIDWSLDDPELEEGWTAEKIESRWDSLDASENGGISRASWFKVLNELGQEDLVSEAAAKVEFEDEPEPEISTGKQVKFDLEKTKRKVRALLKKTRAEGCTESEAATALAKARELMTKYEIDEQTLFEKAKKERPPSNATIDDFWAYLPEHKYIHTPTRKLWPEASISSILGDDSPNMLDCTKPVHDMGWVPGEDVIIKDRLMIDGGYIDKPGSNTFNLYQPPPSLAKVDASKATPWTDHVNKLFPDDCEHITKWMAHRVQFPGAKINHGLIVGSNVHGIGKDTMCLYLIRYSASGTSRMCQPLRRWTRNSIRSCKLSSAASTKQTISATMTGSHSITAGRPGWPLRRICWA